MSRIRGPWLLLLYLVVVLITGAILAPLLYHGGQWYLGMEKSFRLHQTPVLGWLGDKLRNAEFARYFNRAFLVAALVWLIPFSKAAGVTRQDLGLVKNPLRWKDALVGFVLAAGLLLAMGVVFVSVGRFTANPKASVGDLLVAASIAAVAVALLEEFFFRGALFGFLLRSMRTWSALIFLSAFFAILHLLQPPEGLEVPIPTYGSGFWMVGQILGRFGNVDFFLAEFCTLFVVGFILAWARLRTQSLWLSIGLHAGWVFGVKMFSGMTRTMKRVRPEDFMPWIGKDLKSGLAPLLILAFTGALVVGWILLRKRFAANANLTTSELANHDSAAPPPAA
jgi:membrane protease YdiL (CAAX protease family)